MAVVPMSKPYNIPTLKIEVMSSMQNQAAVWKSAAAVEAGSAALRRSSHGQGAECAEHAVLLVLPRSDGRGESRLWLYQMSGV